jgi:hypothetical protein
VYIGTYIDITLYDVRSSSTLNKIKVLHVSAV